jgi:hypothetical protein
MRTHKTTNPELKARLEKALRENLRKRKLQQRERDDDTKQPLAPSESDSQPAGPDNLKN